MSTLIIATIVNENTGVTEAAIAVFIVIFASLWVMIDTSGHLHKCRCFLWAFQSTRELFLFQVILSLNEIIRITILTSIDFRIQLTFTNSLWDVLVLLGVEQAIFLIFLSQELFGLRLMNLLHFFGLGRALIIIGQVLHLPLHISLTCDVLYTCAHFIDLFEFTLSENDLFRTNLFYSYGFLLFKNYCVSFLSCTLFEHFYFNF